MKRVICFFILFFILFLIDNIVLANESTDAVKFFKKYVNAANNYDSSILKMYSPNAKIIRQVVKPNGELVDVETDVNTYIRQLRIGEKTARLRNYKNTYSNVTATKIGDSYKISSLRQPSGETYKLKSYMIIKKQPNGDWKIVEELMQTKVQMFLKYAYKK